MYQDLLIPSNSSGIAHAASILKEGGIVAFPTETVYGLGGNALNAEAVKSIFVAKGRPLTDPLIVHVLNKSAAEELLAISPEERVAFDILSDSFWPGPLTIIAKAASCIPSAVTAETGFVGIRCPAHPLAIALLESSQLPIAAPSANRFAHVSPTRAHHVLSDLGVKGVRVLNGDDDPRYAIDTCSHGIESSVVRINAAEKAFQIFRQGAVTKSDIENAMRAKEAVTDERMEWKVEVVCRVVKMHSQEDQPDAHEAIEDVDVARDDSHGDSAPSNGEIAPGQAVTHYSPDIPCVLVRELFREGSIEPAVSSPIIEIEKWLQLPAVERNISGQLVQATAAQLFGSGIVIIDFGAKLSCLQSYVSAYRDLSPSGNSVEAARNVFEFLRWAELVPGARRVLVTDVATTSDVANDGDAAKLILGLADRVYRSASGVYISLVVSG